MTIEELRVLITAKTEGLQDGINKAKSKLNDFKSTSDNIETSTTRNINRMKSQYDSLLKKLDNVNAQAELQQRKLASMQEKLSGYRGARAESPKAIRLQEQILSTEAKLQKLIETSDKTVNSIHDLDSKMNSAGISTEAANKRFTSLRDRLDQIKDKFKQTGSEAQKSTGKIAGFATMLNRSFMRILKRIFIFNLIYKMIRGLMTYMNEGLKTNDRFASSLNAIKTNLRVAFQPIYDFILPAINALMRALATLTGYIASITSALFGKTYKQSYDAAKGLENAKKGMDGFGASAKKANKQLAGFDEINILKTKEDAGGGGGGSDGFEMTVPEIPEFELGWLDRFKEKLEPTIEAIKRLVEGLEPLKEFAAQGLMDFYNKFLVPVGDWVFGEGLPRFVDAITNGLAKIDWTRINDSLARLWDALAPFTVNVGEGLLWLWEKVLVPYGTWVANEWIPRFLDILANVLNVLNAVIEALKPLAMWLWEEFLQPLAQWTGDKILKALDWLNEKLETLSEWIADNEEKFRKIVVAVGAFGIALGIILSPIGLAGLAIVGLGVFIVGLWKTNEEFRKNVGLIWNKIKELYKIATKNIKDNVETIFNGIKTFWGKHGEDIKGITKKVWDFIGNIINGALKIIEGIIDIFIGLLTLDWSRMGTGLVNIWEGTWKIIETVVGGAWSLLSGAFSGLYSNISGWFTGLAGDALGWGKNLIGGFVDGIKSMTSKVGDSVKGVAGKVGDFIGFKSPTKDGPGRNADKWMPNMMNMLADGIKDNVYKIDQSIGMAANSLSGISKQDNTSSILNAISGLGGNGDTTIIVKIGEDTITEKVVSNINRQSRISGKTIITV